jgi:hypothetical protein
MWLEVLFGIVSFSFTLFVLNETPTTLQLSYIPDAVNGLTIIASILSGFAGVVLTLSYTIHENSNEFRKWFKPRVRWIIFIAFFGFLSISLSSFLLVSNALIWSYKLAFSGWILMIYILMESFLIMIADEDDYLEKENFYD